MLLRFETVHVDRQFRRRHNIGEEDKFPAFELRAIAEIKIFSQGIVLPAARFLDARFAPEAGGTVEIEKASAPAARDLLEQQVTTEKHRLYARKERVAAIKVTPPRLDHSDFRVGEKVHRFVE